MENSKHIIIKDKDIEFCAITQEIAHNDYLIVASHQGKRVGYCHFTIKGNECKLSRIAIIDKDYLGCGIGNYMFKAMENIASLNGAKYLTGIFIPRGYDNAWNITAKFYQRQGMTTEDGEQDYCDRDEISKKMLGDRTEYAVPLVEDNVRIKEELNYYYEINDIFSSIHQKDDVIPMPEL